MNRTCQTIEFNFIKSRFGYLLEHFYDLSLICLAPNIRVPLTLSKLNPSSFHENLADGLKRVFAWSENEAFKNYLLKYEIL